jgi:hypothetical protein
MPVHTQGFGQTLGDSLAVSPGGPIYHSGRVWYVHSGTGDNSYDGRSDKMPLATLAQAQTNASDGDIVVLMDGHAETLTSTLDITKTLVIVGGGKSSGKPTVKFTNNQSNAEALTLSGAGVELRNIWFEEDGTANNDAKVTVTGDNCRLIGCYFELDGNSANGTGVLLSLATGESAELRSCTFVSTATAASSVPGSGIENAGDGKLVMNGVTLDGGIVGFLKGYGYNGNSSLTGLTEGLYADNMTLLRGADMGIHQSTIGFVQVSEDSDEPRIDWDLTGPA